MHEHRESQDLQYQLVQKAVGYGWNEAQIEVVDEDLGKSGVKADHRDGFQRLVATVGLGQVGMILVTDVSRLARNCGDWYHLLDLASLRGVLLCDMNGIYDPRAYDDRLLLGLKGAFSEAQWYTMRQQMQAARENKAKRGELKFKLPVGYERLGNGEVVKAADQEVQGAIELVFNQFERLGSGRAVLKYLVENELQLPSIVQTGVRKGQIAWKKPSYPAIYQILKHPIYAGAYTYGRLQSEHLPGQTGTKIIHQLPIEEWPVIRYDHYPAYISWAQYLANQQ